MSLEDAMDIEEFRRKQESQSLTVDDLADAFESIADLLDRTIERLEQERPPMGAFDVAANITIPSPDDAKAAEAFRKRWGWDAHEQVIIRGQFTTADQEHMENASSAFKGEGRKRKFEVRAGSARRALLERMIVNWTLSQNGRPVAVTPENIGRLPANYRTPIL